MVDKKFEIKIIELEQDLYMDCEACEMYNNCKQTYKECRRYNPLWDRIVDKQIKKIRKEIFNSIIKGDD